MTAAEIVAVLRGSGIEVSVTERGTLRLVPSPPPRLLDAARAAKAEILRLLERKTPEGFEIDYFAIDALRTRHAIPLPDDSAPRPGLRPLTEEEKRQVRTGGVPLPAGVSYGRTATGQWRRLT